MESTQEQLEIWKIKNLIKKYSRAKGSGTSMISLMIKSGGQISLTNQKLTEELGAATNIKSRVNRQSVQTAITSAQQKLKTYSKTPANGLVLLCGIATTEDGKTKKLCEGFDPFKKLNQSQYKCDSRFHLEPLEELLMNHDKYGFIVIDGNGILLANVAGNDKEIIYKESVDLPKKHGRGGQSALRFSRLGEEARHNYLTKCNEMIKKYFTKDNKPIVKGIIIGGSADFKTKLTKHPAFPYVLKPLIMGVIDIQYGGKKGLDCTIEGANEIIPSVKLINEQKVISEYMEHMNKDTSLYCFGVNDVMFALDSGAISKLILWDELDLIRYELSNETVLIVSPDKVNPSLFTDKESGNQLTVMSEMLFLEWIMENYQNYGLEDLCLVSDKSQKGKQFCDGFGGIGGILRWNLDFTNNVESLVGNDEEELDDFDEFEDFI